MMSTKNDKFQPKAGGRQVDMNVIRLSGINPNTGTNPGTLKV